MANETRRLPDELYRQVRDLRLSVLRRVRTGLTGCYASAFRGPGIEFDEFRPYQPGDDVRHIDWHVTARRPEPHVKRYHEERELRVLLALDVSASMGASSAGARALELTAALALSAANNGDRVGGLLFAEGVADTVPPRRGEKHALNFLRRALDEPGGGSSTDLRPVLRNLRNLRAHAVVVLLSDFLTDPAPWEPCVRTLLAACAEKHDMIALRMVAEAPAAAGARVVFEGIDAESGRGLRIDLDPGEANPWARELTTHRHRTLGVLRASGLRALEIEPADDQVSRLRRFLARTVARRPR